MIPPSPRITKPRNSHGCSSCGLIFPSAAALADHVDSPDHRYKCALCKTHYAEVLAFRRHLDLMHSGYMCMFKSCPHWSAEESDIEQHARDEHQSHASQYQKFGNPKSSTYLKPKARKQRLAPEEQSPPVEDGSSQAAGEPAVRTSPSPVPVTTRTPYVFDPEHMSCFFRTATEYVGTHPRTITVTQAACRKSHKDVRSLIHHLSSPVHGFETTLWTISSFRCNVTNLLVHKAGVCQKCWKTFLTPDDLSAHVMSDCTIINLSENRKYEILHHAFALPGRASQPQETAPSPRTTRAISSTRHRSPSPESATDLPQVDEKYMRDFRCCDMRWPSLHDLLQHYEERHRHQTTGAPTRNGGGMVGEPSTAWQGTSGFPETARAGLRISSPGPEEVLLARRTARPWTPVRTSDAEPEVAPDNNLRSSAIKILSNSGWDDQNRVKIVDNSFQQRPSKNLEVKKQNAATIPCFKCPEDSEGFRSEHELRRHVETEHRAMVTKYICVEPDGETPVQPFRSLKDCQQCMKGKQYGAYYNAAAHLRRTHFKERRTRKGKGKEVTIGKGKGKEVAIGKANIHPVDWPPYNVLKLWMKAISVPLSSPAPSTRTEMAELDDDIIEYDLKKEISQDPGLIFDQIGFQPPQLASQPEPHSSDPPGLSSGNDIFIQGLEAANNQYLGDVLQPPDRGIPQYTSSLRPGPAHDRMKVTSQDPDLIVDQIGIQLPRLLSLPGRSSSDFTGPSYGNDVFNWRLEAANNRYLSDVLQPPDRGFPQYKSSFRPGSPLAPTADSDLPAGLDPASPFRPYSYGWDRDVLVAAQPVLDRPEPALEHPQDNSLDPLRVLLDADADHRDKQRETSLLGIPKSRTGETPSSLSGMSTKDEAPHPNHRTTITNNTVAHTRSFAWKFPAHGVTREKLMKCLCKRFPGWDYGEIQLSNDHWIFDAPEPQTRKDTGELMALVALVLAREDDGAFDLRALFKEPASPRQDPIRRRAVFGNANDRLQYAAEAESGIFDDDDEAPQSAISDFDQAHGLPEGVESSILGDPGPSLLSHQDTRSAAVQAAREGPFRDARTVASSLFGDSNNASLPTWQGQPVTAQTDSGYASLPLEKAKEAVVEQMQPSSKADVVRDEEKDDDIGTTYSDDSIQASVSRNQRYVSEFVDHLFGKIKHQTEDCSFAKLAECLPDLLQAFALKVGLSAAATRTHFHVMYFIHRHRRDITQALQNRIEQDDVHESAEVENTDTGPKSMSLDDKLSLWAKMATKADFETEDDMDDLPDIEPLEDEVDLNELYKYQSLITNSPAYEWLVGSLRRELHLDNSYVSGMMDIRRRILQSLPSPRHVSREQAVPPVNVTFTAPWEPMAFIADQGYDRGTDGLLGKVITLTGSSMDVQATTCKQYLCQTWPSTGKHMLRIVEDTVARTRDDPTGATQTRRTYIFPDQTRVTATCADKSLIIEASGTAYSMAEIGEQLGWLITALQASTNESKISMFCPTVTSIQRDTGLSPVYSCDIGMSFVGYKESAVPRELQNGECWQKLFRNPVIVWGYPIPDREDLEAGTGLEIPLDMLVALTDATGISEFDDKIFIKGFSAMLVPTRQVDDIILWHLISNDDRSRIPYTDCRAAALEHIRPTDWRQARHILGWVSHARNNTGSPDANYDIKWSGCGKPRERHAWEKIAISGGGPVGVSASFVIGKKDRGILGVAGGYSSSLRFISKQHVVFYDLDDRRAWLVDGLSALLHMVRASLEHDEKDVCKPHYLYKRGQLKEPPASMHGAEAAAAVLFEPQNYLLKLYIDSEDAWGEETEPEGIGRQGTASVKEVVSKRKVTYYCLKERVLEIFSLLEKMIDHLNNIQAEPGVGFRPRGTPRNILEGFDFMDVATSNTPLRPHMIKLNICESGRGWTDLLRSIQALTLFGKGFGELITPDSGSLSGPACGGCGYGTSMPTGKDYLATCVSTLERILMTRGSTETVPWCLADDIYWHTPGDLFDPCQCASAAGTTKPVPKPHGRVQVLVPSTFPKLWGRAFASPRHLESQGAVMFRHNWRVPFKHSHQTSTAREEAKPQLEPPDSGLGTSVDSSSAQSLVSSSFGDGEDTQTLIATNVSSARSDVSAGAEGSTTHTVDLALRTDGGLGGRKRKLADIVDRVKRKMVKTAEDIELGPVNGGGVP